MSVYLLQTGDRPVVKIGVAKNVRQRVASHQVSQWEPLTVLRQWKGGRIEEQMLHGRFAAHRISGEWFTLVPEMLGDVGLIPEAPVVKARRPLPTTGVVNLRAYLTSNSISHVCFAEAIRVSPQALYRYVAGERIPHRDVMARIAEQTGGKVQPNDFFQREAAA